MRHSYFNIELKFLGGVDWTVGRWDNPDHPIFDVDSAVHPGLDIHKLGYKKSVSEWWDKPWQVCKEFLVSTYLSFPII